MMSLSLCPFCKREAITTLDGKLAKCGNMSCAMSACYVPVDTWQNRPTEDAIQKRVTELEVLLRRKENMCAKSDDEVEQILGKALGFPWYKDDQKNFPGATEENGVCVGDHIPQSIAAVAAKRIQALEKLLIKILSSGSWYSSALEIDQYSKAGFNNGEDMQKAIINTLGLGLLSTDVLEKVAQKEEPSLLGLVGEAFSKENLIKDLVRKARVCPEDEKEPECPRTRGCSCSLLK